MTLSTVIGARPTAASRPRFDAIAAWFVEGAGDPAAPGAADVEACVFANIPPQPGTLQRWVEALRGFGFAVFARPKTQPDDDIDQDMLDHIAVRAHSHRLRRLVVFSGDGRNFAEPLEQLVREGTQVVVVAFSEVAGYAISSDLLRVHRHRGRPGGVRRAAGPGPPRRPAAGRRVAAADPQPAGLRQQLHRPPGPLRRRSRNGSCVSARTCRSPARGGSWPRAQVHRARLPMRESCSLVRSAAWSRCCAEATCCPAPRRCRPRTGRGGRPLTGRSDLHEIVRGRSRVCGTS